MSKPAQRRVKGPALSKPAQRRVEGLNFRGVPADTTGVMTTLASGSQ